jgi:hypothetical protein
MIMAFLSVLFWFFVLIGLLVSIASYFIKNKIDDYKAKKQEEFETWDLYNGKKFEETVKSYMSGADAVGCSPLRVSSFITSKYHQPHPLDETIKEWIRNWEPSPRYRRNLPGSLPKNFAIREKYRKEYQEQLQREKMAEELKKKEDMNE